MRGSVLVAIAATIGNMLQGWDNAAIAGAVMYIKREFSLESEPFIEGLVVAMSLIGATMITTFSGAVSDKIGRRPMLILSSVFYIIGGLVMLWSPRVQVLLVGRFLDGLGVGLAVTLVPLYISETAPTQIRGTLNTLPQFTGSGGMFLSYCMVFGMSLMKAPSWRLMLGVLSIPSIIYFLLMVFYLPESPRWLVSKGRMSEAKKVLQRLRGREDVSDEMALLVEGLGVGGEASLEEYIIAPADDVADDQDPSAAKERIQLYGPRESLSWIARPVTRQSAVDTVSRQWSNESRSLSMVDPLVTLFDSVHEKLPQTGSKRSMLFPHFGSMFSDGGDQARNVEWDEVTVAIEGEDYPADAGGGDSDDNLRTPLISHDEPSLERDLSPIPQSSMMRHESMTEPAAGTTIGGGWQLAWRLSQSEGIGGKNEGELQRIYLHQEGAPGSPHGSLISLSGADIHADGELVQAAALVSRSNLYSPGLVNQQHPAGPAMIHPSKIAAKGPSWKDLLEPGVKHALMVGIGIQILQQFSGINGVMYYTPQILEQAGVGILFSRLGVGSDSATLLISGLTTLLMLPAIGVAMKLMDISGRRTLLLCTIPVLIFSLLVLVVGSIVNISDVANAATSTVSVVLYFCFFVMGFGPIPNILCSEIFPTRVRGLCIAICALTFWFGDIIVTYSLPMMLKSIGLGGVFGFYAVVCFVAWVFVYLKVPETKGMPLEVITEFFSVGSKQAAASNE